MSEILQLEGLTFTVLRSARRRTVGITIERNGVLAVAAPEGAAGEKVVLAREPVRIDNEFLRRYPAFTPSSFALIPLAAGTVSRPRPGGRARRPAGYGPRDDQGAVHQVAGTGEVPFLVFRAGQTPEKAPSLENLESECHG
jgi:hypothetical protein